MTIDEILALDENAFSLRFIAEKTVRPPTLKRLAGLIPEIFPDLKVTSDSWSVTPYVKIGRLRRVTGKRRSGLRITVHPKNSTSFGSEVLFQHHNLEPGRTNWDVVGWIAEEHRRRQMARRRPRKT